MSFMLQEAFRFIEEHFTSLEKFTRGDPEVWDIIYDKVPRLMELWDPLRCDDRDKYIFGQLYLYRLKYWMKLSKSRKLSLTDFSADSDVEGPGIPGIDATVEVSTIIERVDTDDFELLWWRFACGFTLEELSDHYSVCRSSVSQMIRDALDRVRECLE